MRLLELEHTLTAIETVSAQRKQLHAGVIQQASTKPQTLNPEPQTPNHEPHEPTKS